MGLLDSLKLTDESGTESGGDSLELFEQDPDPGERPTRKKRTKKTTATTTTRRAPSTQRLAKQVAEDLAGMVEIAAVGWGMTDQCCAPVLEQQAKPIADAIAGILSRNPRLLAAFANANVVGYTLQTAALGRALLPVGKAIYRNHVAGDGGEGHGVDVSGYPVYGAVSP